MENNKQNTDEISSNDPDHTISVTQPDESHTVPESTWNSFPSVPTWAS